MNAKSATQVQLPEPAFVAMNGEYPTCVCCFDMVARTYRDDLGSLLCKSCYIA